MPTLREVIEYHLNLEGNLPREAQETADRVEAIERSTDKATNAIEKLGRMGGGAIGELTGAFADGRDVVLGLEEAIGATGVAAAAAGITVGLLALGTRELAEAAVEATERLTEQGRAAEIPAEARVSVEAYTSATTELRSELDLMTVQAGQPAVDLMTDLSDVMSGAASGFLEGRDATSEFRQEVSDMFEPAQELTTALVTLGLSVPFRAFADASAGVRELRDETRRLRDELDRGMEDFDKTFVFPALVGRSTEAQPDFRQIGNSMTPEEMYGMLGIPEPGRPTTTPRGPAPKPDTLLDPFGLGSEIYREGQLAVEASNDRLLEGLEAGWSEFDDGVFRLVDELQQQEVALEEQRYWSERLVDGMGVMTQSLRDTQAASAAQTLDLVDALGSTVTGLLDLPTKLRGMIGGLPDQAGAAAMDAQALYDEIPGVLDSLVAENLPTLLSEQMPDMAATQLTSPITMPFDMTKSFIESGPELAKSLIMAGPQMGVEMATELIDTFADFFSPAFWRDLGQAFVDAIKEAFGEVGRDVGGLLDKVTFGLFTPGRNEVLEGPGTTRGASYSSGLPYMDTEEETGPKRGGGSSVVRGEASRSRGGGGVFNIQVTANSPRELMRELRMAQGTYGINESLLGWE